MKEINKCIFPLFVFLLIEAILLSSCVPSEISSTPSSTVIGTTPAITTTPSTIVVSVVSSSSEPAPSTSTPVVTSTADSGPGSLRQCMNDAFSGTVITFDPSVFPPSNPARIVIKSPPLSITRGNITIDASNAGVILDGSEFEGLTNGIDILSDNNVIMGLQVVNFSNGIGVSVKNMLLAEIEMGIGPTGQGNVVSGNYQGIGISIGGIESTGNVVKGNIVGLDASGLHSISNDGSGIAAGFNGASFNRIGGTRPEERNIVSGDNNDGIQVLRMLPW